MAQGDLYCNCDRTNESLHQILRKMIVSDSNNNPIWNTNISTSPVWPPIEEGYEYYTELKNYLYSIPERDGMGLFETGGKIRLIGGWNGSDSPTSKKEQWESSDGITYTQIADAPWSVRHNFAYGFRNDGKLWLWGGDNIIGTQKDVWTYDSVNGWVQITSDWGSVAGVREGYSYCIHNDYMYLIGGTILDCVRSNDGITWTKMSNIPAGLVSFSHGFAASHRGVIYICGGNSTVQNKVYKSEDDGATWIACPDLPVNTIYPLGPKDTSAWPRLFSWSDRLFYLAGAGPSGNANGMWYSEDEAQTWKRVYAYPIRPSHARGVGAFGNDIYIASGNAARDSNRLTKTLKVNLAPKCVYSVRKAVSTYTGSCLRVRRSSDSTESDIGFSGNDLDTAALASFAGAATAYVVRWYDQSGNGNDLVQTNVVNAPLIRAGGTNYTLNGKVCLYFYSTAINMRVASNVNLSSKYIMSCVFSMDALSRAILYSPTANRYGMFIPSNAMYHNLGVAGTTNFLGLCNATNATATQYLWEFYRNRMHAIAYQNGVAKTFNSTTFERADYEFTDFRGIGGESPAYTGRMQEINIKSGFHDFDQHSTIQSDINGYFNVYV